MGSLYVPNVFSPNNDGFNDDFRAYPALNVEVMNYELQVFDRWGNKVFESHTSDLFWDGYYKGKKAATGTYAYYI